LGHIEQAVGKTFGDPADPLLVSVRSGARVSMPGMMDTVLNLGLNDATVQGLASSSGDARFAWDSYRRFIQMYSDVVLGIDHHLFEDALEIAKEDKGYYADVEMQAEDWQTLVKEYAGIVEAELGAPVPAGPDEQLWGAIRAVFDSWDSDRAKVYRRLNDIPGDGARPSTCRRWCSATWATPRPPALPSPAIRRRARRPITASGWSTPRAKTWSPASARRSI
jgi:pyruvate,orthophosphate dikinase